MYRLRLVHEERGIALVMALGFTLVLSIALVTIISVSDSSSRQASYSRTNEDAFSYAEAGLNNAYAVLAKAAEDDNTNSSRIFDPTLLATPRTTSFSNGGSVEWSGTYASTGNGGIWTLTATGKRFNPTGPGASDVTRTVSAKVRVYPDETQGASTTAWNYVYMKSTGAECDLEIKNTVTLGSRLYLPGNLCVEGNTTVTGGSILVGGNVYIKNQNGSIGTSSNPISAGTAPEETSIGGQCKWKTEPWQSCKNGPGSAGNSNIWVQGYGDGQVISTSVETIAPPTADFPDMYENASVGPRQSTCHNDRPGTTTLPASTFDVVPADGFGPALNGTIQTEFELTPPTYSYTCKTSTGELSWDSTARALTISGSVYIDGSAVVTGSGHTVKTLEYDGIGTIWLSGTMRFSNQIKLCAYRSGNECDWNAWDANGDGLIDEDADMLFILANGNGGHVPVGSSIQMEQSTQYQGGLYGTHSISLEQSTVMQGPILGQTLFNGNSAETKNFPFFDALPSEVPGNTTTEWKLGKPEQYSG